MRVIAQVMGMTSTTLALWLFAAWFLLAFVVRGALQWRRTGDHGFRIGTERVGSVAWWAHAAFTAALLLSLVAPIAAATDLVEPVAALDSSAGHAVGAVVVVVGIVATFVAQLAMGRSWRVGVDETERTELVVRWPFTVVRNPIFTTMALTAVGFAVLVPSVVSLAALVLLAAALEYQVRAIEEPYLRSVHGPAYERYLAQVGRFVPGLGRT